MSISFEKHREQIIAAWKDVLDDKSSTNWSLFDYEPHSNELKVNASGEEGIDELCENLNSGKIMYAFVRIEDPTTGLQKFLLINWQGEGAPVLRKGTCAKHIYDVAKLLSGAQLTINARNEDDIDMERLLKKLSTVSSAYSFKQPRTAVDEQKTPVGTNYTRVIPTKELNASVMQDFWKKEEAEEKRRIAAEKETKQQQMQKQEKEQRTREEKEHRAREEVVVSVTKLQSAHVPIKTTPKLLSPEKSASNFNVGLTEAERMRQMRNQEARELIGSRVGAAKAIFTQNTSEGQLQTKLNTAPPAKPARNSIAQRINAFNQPQQPLYQQQQQPQPQPQQQQIQKQLVTTPKANVESFKDNVNDDEVPLTIPPPLDFAEIIPTAIAADTFVKSAVNLQEPVKPEMTAIANQDDLHLTSEDFAHEQQQQQETEQYSTIKRSPHTKTNSLQSPDEMSSSSNATDTAVYQDQDDDDDDDEKEAEKVRTKVSVTVQQAQSAKNGLMSALERNELTDLVNEDDFICQATLGDLGLSARALYDYQAADDSEITFDPGDIISHIDQIDEGWWQGLGPDGTYGLFPANYVEIIN